MVIRTLVKAVSPVMETEGVPEGTPLEANVKVAVVTPPPLAFKEVPTREELPPIVTGPVIPAFKTMLYKNVPGVL